MEKYCRTDLACELCREENRLPDGVTHTREESVSGFILERLFIPKENEAEMKKPAGNYITVHCGMIQELEDDERSILSRLIADELLDMSQALSGKGADGEFNVLVAGLGNEDMTPDAIGPGAVQQIEATAHLRTLAPQLFESLDCCAVSAVSPGVLGQTGIETAELIRGAVNATKPDIVLVIDALASRSPERLASTVQLSDCGLRPGSGIGNKREALTKETLGVPVIAIGVPTMTDSSSLVYDALSRAGIREDLLSPELKGILENGKNYFVALKDCDAVTESVCNVLASSIKKAFGIKI